MIELSERGHYRKQTCLYVKSISIHIRFTQFFSVAVECHFFTVALYTSKLLATQFTQFPSFIQFPLWGLCVDDGHSLHSGSHLRFRFN